MVQRILLCFLFAGLSLSLSAQIVPVEWSFNAKHIGGEEYELTFTADIDEGWYVYSQFLEEGGPVPTTIRYQIEGMATVGTATELSDYRKEGFDDIFEMQLIKFGKQLKIVQKVKAPAGANVITGYLTYMTCNDESCLPPRDVDFEFALK